MSAVKAVLLTVSSLFALYSIYAAMSEFMGHPVIPIMFPSVFYGGHPIGLNLPDHIINAAIFGLAPTWALFARAKRKRMGQV